MPSATPAAEASQRSAKGLAKMRPPGPLQISPRLVSNLTVMIRASQQDRKIKGSNPVELIYLLKVVPTLFKSTSASVTSCTRTNYEFNKLNH